MPALVAQEKKRGSMMFESYRFETDTCQELLEELRLMEPEVGIESSAFPDDVYDFIEEPNSLFISEGPWPFSARLGRWAS